MADSKNNNSDPSRTPDDQLQAIQQIIVGPALTALSDRINTLEKQLEAQSQELSTLVADTRGELEQNMEKQHESLLADLQASKKELLEEMAQLDQDKVSRKHIGQLLIDLGEALMNTSS